MSEQPIIIGLTGSIGTGKTTIARFLKKIGFPIFNADTQVSRLLQTDQQILKQIHHYWPFCFEESPFVLNKKKLAHHVFSTFSDLEILENIVHPQVDHAMQEFLRYFKHMPYLIIESPLLFEAQTHKQCHWVVATTCAPDIQKQRVLKRLGMSETLYKQINDRQMPDIEKRQRADYVIDTTPHLTQIVKQLRLLLQKCPLPRTIKPIK